MPNPDPNKKRPLDEVTNSPEESTPKRHKEEPKEEPSYFPAFRTIIAIQEKGQSLPNTNEPSRLPPIRPTSLDTKNLLAQSEKLIDDLLQELLKNPQKTDPTPVIMARKTARTKVLDFITTYQYLSPEDKAKIISSNSLKILIEHQETDIIEALNENAYPISLIAERNPQGIFDTINLSTGLPGVRMFFLLTEKTTPHEADTTNSKLAKEAALFLKKLAVKRAGDYSRIKDSTISDAVTKGYTTEIDDFCEKLNQALSDKDSPYRLLLNKEVLDSVLLLKLPLPLFKKLFALKADRFIPVYKGKFRYNDVFHNSLFHLQRDNTDVYNYLLESGVPHNFMKVKPAAARAPIVKPFKDPQERYSAIRDTYNEAFQQELLTDGKVISQIATGIDDTTIQAGFSTAIKEIFAQKLLSSKDTVSLLSTRKTNFSEAGPNHTGINKNYARRWQNLITEKRAEQAAELQPLQ